MMMNGNYMKRCNEYLHKLSEYLSYVQCTMYSVHTINTPKAYVCIHFIHFIHCTLHKVYIVART